MSHRYLSATVVALWLSVVCVPSASATPVTLTIEGGWSFINFEYLFYPREEIPEYWAFDDAIRATGAATSMPGELPWGVWGFSLTFDTDAVDLDPSADYGHFAGALTGKAWLGDTVFSFGPTDVYTHRGGGIYVHVVSLSGPTLTANGFAFVPTWLAFLELRDRNFASDALSLSNFANAQWQELYPDLTFNGWTHEVGGYGQVVKVTVPEPGSLSLSLGALAGLLWIEARHRA